MNQVLKRVKLVCQFLAFMIIITYLFSKITWLYRGNAAEPREDILGFKNQGTVDVVLYGGSNLLRYYQPLEAWNKFGYTSYNYATSSAKADLLQAYIEESRTKNEAILYVCDIRSITMVNSIVDDSSLRNWSDSISVWSLPRLKGITEFLFNRNWEEADVPSFYFDIIKYHSNKDVLSQEYQWAYLNESSVYNIDKGFEPNKTHVPFEQPCGTEVRGNLSEQQVMAINNLLDYCDREELNVLFICCPYIIPENEWEIINTCGDMIRQRGYTYLNFNEYYDEIGLDFETDFGDINHVNFLGAEKYTDFLMNYIYNNYELPDHRQDADYNAWNEDYLVFQKNQSQWKENIESLVKNHLEARQLWGQIQNEINFSKWYSYINNSNYTVIIKTDEGFESIAQTESINGFLADYSVDSSGYVGVWNVDNCLGTSDTQDEPVSVKIGVDGGRGRDNCVIEEGRLQIAGVDYTMNEIPLQIIVYDNNYKKVIDNVGILCDDDGEIYLER